MKTIKKILTNIFVMLIWNREKRRKVRRCILNFHLIDSIYYLHFLFFSIRKNSIVLIETNNCHGEVISGYVQYFQKMGFHLDVFVALDVKAEKPFCRLDMKKVNVFCLNHKTLTWILKLKKIMQYKHLLVMSSAYYAGIKNGSYTSVFDEFPGLKNHPSLYVVEHDLIDIPRFKEEELLKKNRLITLGHFDKGVFVAPILFGDIQKSPKNEITTFITIGAIKSFRKNHQALIQAIEQLASQNVKFKVIIVGSGTLKNLPKSVHPYIKIMGRLDFPKMFDCMEKADFFLPLLDPDNPEHNRYITTGVTGSAQLIYAFSKVPVLHPKFAPFYRLNNDNAIVAEDLAEGMRQAIQMTTDKYKQKQSALTDLAQKLERESFDNLKEILK